MHPSRPNNFRRGFTLIEILIVVIILGILAAIVIPQFTTATNAARESTLKENLRDLRTQIMAFRLQHHDISPGYPGGDVTAAPDEANFVDQMTKYTNESCGVNAVRTSEFTYGPYLRQLPPNPLNAKTGFLVVTVDPMPDPDESQPYGWIYNPVTQKVVPNNAGLGTDGTAYRNY